MHTGECCVPPAVVQAHAWLLCVQTQTCFWCVDCAVTALLLMSKNRVKLAASARPQLWKHHIHSDRSTCVWILGLLFFFDTDWGSPWKKDAIWFACVHWKIPKDNCRRQCFQHVANAYWPAMRNQAQRYIETSWSTCFVDRPCPRKTSWSACWWQQRPLPRQKPCPVYKQTNGIALSSLCRYMTLHDKEKHMIPSCCTIN